MLSLSLSLYLFLTDDFIRGCFGGVLGDQQGIVLSRLPPGQFDSVVVPQCGAYFLLVVSSQNKEL